MRFQFLQKIEKHIKNSYLKRVDRILSWCKQNRIPVKTLSEWAGILYHTRQDPRVNVFPGLDVDRDGDGIPDGYDVLPEKLDRNDGVPDSSGFSLAMEEAGTICRVERLGGLEKGANCFTIWTKGSAGSSIEVTFRFFEVGKAEELTFPAENPEWTKHQGTVTVPPSASLVNISIDCVRFGEGALKISGMSLRQPTQRGVDDYEREY